MVFFRKNKRQFGIHSHRRLFAALFLFAVAGISFLTSFILNVSAQDAPIKSVEITSSHTSYVDNEQGAWKVTKSATWTDIGKARITFKINSRAKFDNTEQYDIVMVIDNSASMDGQKLIQVKTDAARLVQSLLTDNRNRISIVSFSTDATIRTGFTNDQTELFNQINAIPLGGQTNYYKGLLKAEEVLENYTEQDGRNLILLFLTDGAPNEDVANGMAEYQVLKAKYPGINISGIQYEMGDTILQPIIDISDHQFVADMDTLNNVLFNATVMPYIYDNFVITDYIDQRYWSIAGVDSISATIGTTTLEDGNGTPKVTWDLSGIYRAGQTATMTIDIDLNSEYLTMQDITLPTNTHETISTSLIDTPSEDTDSNLTPVLADRYSVIYNANKPSDCENVIGTIPDTQKYTITTIVEVSNSPLTCEGYEFKGWSSPVNGDYYVNDDYFRMPGEDVIIRAIWAKPNIEKSLDGSVKSATLAILDNGEPVNAKLKALAGHENGTYETSDSNVVAIKRSTSVPSNIDLTNDKYIITHMISPLPVYAWYDSTDHTLYYYSDAEIIYYYGDARGMFANFTNLTNISGLSDFSAEYLYDPEYMFYNTPSLTDFSVLSTWYTPRLRSLYFTFGYSGISDLAPLKNWDVSGVYNMSYMFYAATNFTDIDDLEDWETGNVQFMDYMFSYAYSLENIDGATGWDTSLVSDMSNMFMYATSLENIDGAINWNVSNVVSMKNMFNNASSLENIDGAINWRPGKVQTMQNMFKSATSLEDIDGAIDWTTGNVTDMSYMFNNASSLSSLAGAAKWDVSKVTTMSSMFYSASSIPNIDALYNWKTTSLTDMYMMFNFATSLTNVNGAAKWDVGNVTTMNRLFNSNTSLTNIDGLENWDVSNVLDMTSLFSYDTGLTSLSKLHKWRPSSATNMTWMFAHVSNIESLDGLQDWTVSSNTDFANMFYNLTKITSVSELSSWRPTSATTMNWMFGYTNSVTSYAPLESWNVPSTVDISNIFYPADSSIPRPAWAGSE